MAGIGFTLRSLAARDALSARAAAYGHAALTSAGPWLFTILALAGIQAAGTRLTAPEEVGAFSVVVIYNFCFSLVIAGPVTMVATRYLADHIHLKQVDTLTGMLFGGLVLIFGMQALIGGPFYLLLTDQTPAERLLSLAGFFLIGGIWQVGVFLTALKSYWSVTASFAAGMLIGFALGVALAGPFGAAGMLGGFTVGLGVIFFTLTARVLAEYPYPVARPFAFLAYFRRYADLALCGLVCNLALWIDKWIMWFAPGRTVQAGVMASHPVYDGAMFLAYLTLVPGMALFLVLVETRFFDRYVRFYAEVRNHGSYDQIERAHRSLLRVLGEGFQTIGVLQAMVCCFAIMVSPMAIGLLGGGAEQLGVLRFGVLGALFHGLFVFALIVLAYFDLRRPLLALGLLFLATNGLFTLGALPFGFAYHGYGYFLAAVVSFFAAYLVVADSAGRLPYLTFIGNNPSIR